MLWPNEPAVGQPFTVDGRACLVVGVIRDLLPDLPDRVQASTVVVGTELSGWLGATLPSLIARATFSGVSVVPVLNRAVQATFVGATAVSTATLLDSVNESMGNERLGARFFGWFGSAASLLAILGMHGLVTLAVLHRRQELAIRSALGAAPWSLRWISVNQIILTVSVGLICGLVATRVLTHVLQASIVDLERPSAANYLTAVLVFAAGGALSALLGTAGLRRMNIQRVLHSDGESA